MSKHTTIILIDMLAPELHHNTDRGHTLPPYLTVLTALRFFASAKFLLLLVSSFR